MREIETEELQPGNKKQRENGAKIEGTGSRGCHQIRLPSSSIQPQSRQLLVLATTPPSPLKMAPAGISCTPPHPPNRRRRTRRGDGGGGQNPHQGCRPRHSSHARHLHPQATDLPPPLTTTSKGSRDYGTFILQHAGVAPTTTPT